MTSHLKVILMSCAALTAYVQPALADDFSCQGSIGNKKINNNIKGKRSVIPH